jgi:hypothetical protein
MKGGRVKYIITLDIGLICLFYKTLSGVFVSITAGELLDRIQLLFKLLRMISKKGYSTTVSSTDKTLPR